MQILRQLDVHPKVREEADILVRTFSGAVGKVFDLCHNLREYRVNSTVHDQFTCKYAGFRVRDDTRTASNNFS